MDKKCVLTLPFKLAHLLAQEESMLKLRWALVTCANLKRRRIYWFSSAGCLNGGIRRRSSTGR